MDTTTGISSRNISIDLVKVVAMFMVMTLHAPIAIGYNPMILAGVYTSGIAIPLFFIVSGWLIINKNGGYRYSFRKIIGIIKFILILSIAYYFIEVFLQHKNLSIKDIILAAVNPLIQKGIFSVFWYLGAMILVYLAFPIVKWLHSKYEQRGLITLILFLFACEAFIFPLNIVYQFEKEYVIQPLRLWNWLFYFAIGALIRESVKRHISIKWIYILLLALSYVIFAYKFSPLVGAWEYLYASPMCILYSIITFLFLVNLKVSKNFFTKTIQFFAKLFLPVYALHIIVLVNMNKFLPPPEG